MALITETTDPVSAQRPAPDRAIVVALALALAAHTALIAGVALIAPRSEPRSSPLLELMVVTEPGTKSADSVTALVAAQDRRAGETQTQLPEIDTSVAALTDLNAAMTEDAPATEQADQALSSTPALAPLSSASDAAPGSKSEAPRQAPTRPVELAAPLPAPINAASSTRATSLEPESRLEPRLALENLKAEDQEVPAQPDEPDPVELAPEITERAKIPDLANISTADILASRNAEMANLAARIQERGSAYASRTRRKAISTATREYIYATYMEAWRRKVERIGNLNYPSEARELGLFGSLILHVAVRSDGSLEGIRVVRSSGHDVLDQAAIRIVELAAPFAPFPANIKSETDVLDITRTWQFQRNHELGWGR